MSQAVRDSEWESREIARVRASQEQGIALEVPYYDVCRVKVCVSGGGGAGRGRERGHVMLRGWR